MSKIVDYYELLEISQDASEDEIKKKHREKTRIWNQRVNSAQSLEDRQEADRKVQHLAEAKVILLDANKRQKYNQELEDKKRNKQQSATSSDASQTTYDYQEMLDDGWESLKSGYVDKALDIAKKLTAKYGDMADAWVLLAQAKFRDRQVDDAIYEYKRAIDLKPTNPDSHLGIAYIYDACNKNDNALYHYQKAVEYGRAISYRMSLSRFYIKLNQLRNSIDILEQCLRESPEEQEVRDMLAISYLFLSLDILTVTNNKILTRENIKLALQMLDRVDELNANLDHLKPNPQQLRKEYCSHLKRKFTGDLVWGAISSFIWAIGIFQNIFLPFFGIFFGIYYFACRTPKFAIKGPEKSFGFFTILIFPIVVLVYLFKNYTGDNMINNDDYLAKALKGS